MIIINGKNLKKTIKKNHKLWLLYYMETNGKQYLNCFIDLKNF